MSKVVIFSHFSVRIDSKYALGLEFMVEAVNEFHSLP